MTTKQIDEYQYNQNDLLGSGSFGMVYRGINIITNQQVAVKMINRKNIDGDPYLKSALFAEVGVMRQLQSANVVRFIQLLETSNNYYIILEFCKSGDLQNALKSAPNQRFPEKEAVQIMAQILKGYMELLNAGITHRDLKPANIMIDNGTYKLADFGFAKQLEYANTKINKQTRVGTPLYMSPEILNDSPYGNKSDTWSLGIIFYELISGNTPYIANSETGLCRAIEKEQLKFNNLFSSQVQDLIAKMLIKDENQRISWEKIYQHPVFKSFFNSQNVSENRLRIYLTNIRNKIMFNNVDVYTLFKKYQQQNHQLDIQRFQIFIREIDNKMSQKDIEEFFQLIDLNKDHQLSFDEIKICFQEAYIEVDKLGMGFIDQYYQCDQVSQLVLQSLKNVFVQFYEGKVQKIYSKYQTLQGQKWDKGNFKTMIEKVAGQENIVLNDAQISLMFKMFDKTLQNRITEEQLQFGVDQIPSRNQQQQQQQHFQSQGHSNSVNMPYQNNSGFQGQQNQYR